MRRPRTVSREAVISTALAGTIVGHWLAYAAAFRDPAARHGALASTGHSWLHLGRQAIVVLLVAAVLSIVLDVVRRQPRDARPGERYIGLAGRVAALQVGSFLTVEVTERLLAHAALGALVRDHVLLLGVAAQLGVALVGAAVLVWLTRAAVRVVRELGPKAPATTRTAEPSVPPLPEAWRPRLQVLRGASGVRGPPAPFLC